MDKTFSCVSCSSGACGGAEREFPSFCPTQQLKERLVAQSLAEYEVPENKKIAIAAAETECEAYGVLTRVEETVLFAKKIGAKKLGIATCLGLVRESQALQKILSLHGFDVYGISCKAGTVEKTAVGIPKECEKVGVNMCNPILQAKKLNAEKTDLNIVMGLCIGHDSLFYKYSDAFVTTLVVKDRITGHNPVAVLYQLHSCYKKLCEG